MKILRIAAAMLLIASVAWATNPTEGPQGDWVLTVTDGDIDATAELVDSNLGFTQMSADTTIRVAYAAQSKLDSIRAGNQGPGTLRAVFTDGTTANQAVASDFLQDKGTGTVSAVTAVFTNGYSPEYGAYMTRIGDSSFNLGDEWAVAVFSKGMSPGNPGVGTVQTVFSLASSVIASGTQYARIQYTEGGFLTGVVSDDGGATEDSLVCAVDVYDSTYSVAVFSCASSTLRLKVGSNTATTKSLTNCTSVLGSTDDLGLFATQAGENWFRGHLDEVILAEDVISLNSEMENYLHAWGQESLGNPADSALVHLRGVKSDGSRGGGYVTVPVDSFNTTTTEFMLFEQAYADSEETMPIVVYATDDSPSSTQLDSIPAGKIWLPIAHLTVPDDCEQLLKSVTASIEGTTDDRAITYEVRVYPDLADARDLSDGYYVVARPYVSDTSPVETVEINHIVTEYGYVAIYATGSAANQTGTVTLRGRRIR